MNWTLTPDQFAMAWERTDGDRIPYPLAVRLSARDSMERAAQLPALHAWCDRTLDADLAAALRVLARPAVRVEVFGEHRPITRAATLDDEQLTDAAEFAIGATVPGGAGHGAGDNSAANKVRILGAASGNISVVAAQRPGQAPDRGGDIRLYVGSPKNLPARVISVLPENPPGSTARLSSPLSRVKEDSRDLVTVPVSGPSAPARIRRLLARPRDGIGQIVVSVRRGEELKPFGVLCWIDVAEDGRYAVRTGADVHVAPVTAEIFAAHLRPMLTAAEKTTARSEHW
ncbi:ESX secretion-associated protein EspG [Nocardia xishanensis]|uniref:ESX secretion-associated protein EspG n=1 Tax=Nocardia xishanensis TaxID=238964 RepID=UPI00083017AD|nr:ESX secretion-associated protein EspG [Nocardia xishanensis]